MKQRALATVLVAALAVGATAPALADGAASTRNIILFSAAATVFTVNYVKKVRQKRQEQKEVSRRQDAYRDWFYHKYNYYPTYDQFKQWYVQTYNTSPE
ncbi:MAG: hypothetical protein JO029_13110 [Candidatus Eremiobacteraeota bacterium]|nr:hypothetical protein [Candidatus Eremiobacteraeota bacterium]MBV8435213.1 hypothetical protein [Candidatus Eremiobacteraeota bacterium]